MFDAVVICAERVEPLGQPPDRLRELVAGGLSLSRALRCDHCHIVDLWPNAVFTDLGTRVRSEFAGRCMRDPALVDNFYRVNQWNMLLVGEQGPCGVRTHMALRERILRDSCLPLFGSRGNYLGNGERVLETRVNIEGPPSSFSRN